MKQVDVKDWKEVAHPIQLCELPLFPDEISKKYGLSFFEVEEMGLGTLETAVIEIEGSLFWLQCPILQRKLGVIVYVRSFEENNDIALKNLLNAFELNETDLNWKKEIGKKENYKEKASKEAVKIMYAT